MKNKDIKQLQFTEIIQILLAHSEICLKFVPEWVEIVHFFSMITNFSVQALRSLSF